MNIKDDNKNMKMLRDELWTRKISIKVEIVIFRENQI